MQLHDFPSYANSKNVVLVKHFVGGTKIQNRVATLLCIMSTGGLQHYKIMCMSYGCFQFPLPADHLLHEWSSLSLACLFLISTSLQLAHDRVILLHETRNAE